MKSFFNKNKSIECEKEIKKIVENTRFTENQIIEMKSRFSKVSKKHNKLNRDQFRQHMGLLGIDSALFLSDRIFNMLDVNNDESVDFEEFMKYLDILLNGNPKEKNEWSYRLIDVKKRGYFDLEDFKSLFDSMVNIWAFMTGIQINNEILKNLQVYVKQMFIRIDIRKEGQVTLSDFLRIVEEEPNILEIFDVLNKGLTQTNEASQKSVEHEIFVNSLMQIKTSIDMMILELQGDKFSLKKLKTSESPSPSSRKKKQQPSSFFDFKDPSQQCRTTSRITIDKKGFSPVTCDATKPISFSIEEEKFFLIDEYEIRSEKSEKTLQLKRNPSRKLINKTSVLSFTKTEINFENYTNIEKKTTNNNKNLKLKRSMTPELKGSDYEFENNNKEKDKKIEVSDDLMINSVYLVENFQTKTNNIITKLKKINEDIKATNCSINGMYARLQKSPQNKDKSNMEIENFRVKKEEIIYNKMKTHTVQNIPKKKSYFFKGKPNQTSEAVVFLGHHNWNLVLNMMIGIQTALKSLFLSNDYKLTKDDFKISYFFEIIPRKYNNSKNAFKTCRFYDYSPYVFLKLREHNNIRNEEYLKSIGPERLISNLIKGNVNTLSELVSTGKSGSFFYYTADGKYTLKTIHKGEHRFFKKILRNYYEHLISNKHSFINKIYGLHKIKYKVDNELNNKPIYFIIMENILNTDKVIHERYDLKGSLYKRKTFENDPSIAKKDINALETHFNIEISNEISEKFLRQLESDCHFFEQNNIIDYSLLIGIHKKTVTNKLSAYTEKTGHSSFTSFNLLSNYPIESSNNFNRCINSVNNIYYLGIIDILTCFNFKKKLEYKFKALVFGPTISAIPPDRYAMRFMDFIKNNIISIRNDTEEDGD